MGTLDLFFHLLSFAAPAVAVGALVALAAPLVQPRQPAAMPWWGQVAANSIAGGLVLAAGLWHFGADGKMASYGALVMAIASCQWGCNRAWRS